MDCMTFLSCVLLPMFVTMALTPSLSKLAVRIKAMDIPNHRKIHHTPTPRIGGLAMACGASISIVIWPSSLEILLVRAVLLSVGILVIFGILDDCRNLGYKTKMIGQILAALVMILYGGIKIKTLGGLMPDGFIIPDMISIPLTLITFVGVTNAINFSDGLDGLAGGICLLTFFCIASLAYLSKNITICLLCLGVIGSILGFLRFNTHPATIFMGDAGSQFLGFLAATFSIVITQQDRVNYSAILPLFILGLPILDALSVILERIIKRKSPFISDNNHFHYKLIKLGLYHMEAVFILYSLQGAFIVSAFIFRFSSDIFLLAEYIIFSGLIFSGFIIAGHKQWRSQRIELIEKNLKSKLNKIKKEGVLIKFSFRIVLLGIPLILLTTCLLPAKIPLSFSYSSIFLSVLIAAVWFLKKSWMSGLLRILIYSLIPFIIYLSENGISNWIKKDFLTFYHISFGLMIIFILLTIKFTRRKKLRSSPMDFLILFIVLLVPNLPDDQIQSLQLGPMAAKIIFLIFGYELILTELRGKNEWLWASTIFALTIVGIKGIIGSSSLVLVSPIPITFSGFIGFSGFLVALRISRRSKASNRSNEGKVTASDKKLLSGHQYQS